MNISEFNKFLIDNNLTWDGEEFYPIYSPFERSEKYFEGCSIETIEVKHRVNLSLLK